MHHMYLFSNLNETALKQTEILQGFKSNKKKRKEVISSIWEQEIENQQRKQKLISQVLLSNTHLTLMQQKVKTRTCRQFLVILSPSKQM